MGTEQPPVSRGSSTETEARSDLTRIVLTTLIIGLLIVGSLWTLRPFLGAVLWATTIVVATWPLLLRVQRRVGGRRAPATAIMTVAIVAVFIVPFALAVGILLDAALQGFDLLRTVAREGLPPPPDWLTGIPWAGERIGGKWQELAAGGPATVTEAMRPYVRATAGWALAVTGGFGSVAIHFLLTVVVAAILYNKGEAAAGGVLRFGRRLGRERGEHAVRLAGQALRGVTAGVVLTALVQSLIAGIGLWLAGIPRPGLLLAMVFVLSLAQLGPLPVLVPAVVWLFWTGNVVWAGVLVLFTVIVLIADNVLKPVLIRRGVDLPMLLIIAGVIGGVIGFGIVGLFIGPVLLAVTYTLLQSWMYDTP